MGAVRRLLILLVSAVALTVVSAPSASAAGAWGSDGCGNSERQPRVIAFSCADGKVVFQPDEWIRWRTNEAVASGLLRHPDRPDPSCAERPLSYCPWVASKATVRFSESSYCPSNGRWQFLHLRLDAPEDPDPSLRSIDRRLRCSEYERLEPAGPPPGPYWRDCGYPNSYALQTVIAHRVSCGKARRLIRKVWRTAFPGGPGDVQRVNGFRCVYDFPGGKRPISCKRGSHKVRGPFAGGGD